MEGAMTRARVLIVEDEVIVAEDLRRSLNASGYDVIGHAMDGREAIDIARHLRPDVILMDVVLGGGTNGIQAARSIQRIIDTSIIYVTGQSNEALVSDAVRSGAFGYVVKPFQTCQITSSIKIALHRRREARALDERTSMTRRLHALLPDEGARSSYGNNDASATIQALCVTPREKEVVRALICYRRLSRVADVLGISVHTARNHLKSVFRKLNLHSQDELLGYLLDETAPSQSN
jgi:DNA-binding NarL/FixJ family response regulator